MEKQKMPARPRNLKGMRFQKEAQMLFGLWLVVQLNRYIPMYSK